MKKAILFPANPNRKFVGGQDEGSIEAHIDVIRSEGAVYWRLVSPGCYVAGEFAHDDVRKGYLYDVDAKRVTHSCDISWIKPMQEIPFTEAQKYVLGGFRDQTHFDELAEDFYALSIDQIVPLKQAHPIGDFNKYKDGKPVKLVRNYCIIQDPEF